MKYFKKIVGERVYLSPYSTDDIEIFTKWLNDRAVTDGLGDSAMQFNLLNEKEWMEGILKKGEHSYAIVMDRTDEVVGSIGLFEVKNTHGTATVGLFIGEATNRGKGLGTEAMKLMVGYAFDVLNFQNIMLNVFEFNKGAYKSYLKVGFKEFGRRRKAVYLDNKRHDIIFMDITREDWYNGEND
ncbi:MAG: GNAT family N-acetyltransferase [Oscillospiraceae bacterium]|nr:GNAT family N-acetyltransferase [Oscillospiraceae bacterium]